MRLRFLAVAAGCMVAAACANHNALPTPSGGAALPHAGPAVSTAGPPLYVADTPNNAVDSFASTSNGDVAPDSVIAGPLTLLDTPNGVAVGTDGTIYVSNDGVVPSITAYPAGSSGDTVPSRVITCGGLSRPGGISLDGAGNLYVANIDGKSISVFAPTDNGCVSNNRTIVGLHTCLFNPQDVDVRDDGTAYVASQGRVLVFRPGAHGDATPIQKIVGSNTLLLTHVMGVSFDSAFNIYATSVGTHNKGRVTVYAPGATGNVAPLWTIDGPKTQFGAVDKIEIDPSDEAFVSNDASVEIFSAGASGNVPPVRVIAGPTTTLLAPAGMDIVP